MKHVITSVLIIYQDSYFPSSLLTVRFCQSMQWMTIVVFIRVFIALSLGKNILFLREEHFTGKYLFFLSYNYGNAYCVVFVRRCYYINMKLLLFQLNEKRLCIREPRTRLNQYLTMNKKEESFVLHRKRRIKTQ